MLCAYKNGNRYPNPVDIGVVSMDLDSGDIIPKQISANGYTLNVKGPGETTITKD